MAGEGEASESAVVIIEQLDLLLILIEAYWAGIFTLQELLDVLVTFL